jgi:hypothetical protein
LDKKPKAKKQKNNAAMWNLCNSNHLIYCLNLIVLVI